MPSASNDFLCAFEPGIFNFYHFWSIKDKIGTHVMVKVTKKFNFNTFGKLCACVVADYADIDIVSAYSPQLCRPGG